MIALPAWLAVAAALAAGEVVAPPGEDLLGRTVVEVLVDGADPATLPEARSLVGAPLTRAAVRGLIEALWDSDRFRDVRVGAQALADGLRVVVTVSPRQRVRTLEASGNAHFDLRELRRVAGFVPDAEESPDLLQEMRGRIEAAYAARGYPNASVSMRTEETPEPGRVVLVADVIEGEPTRVASVDFTGTPELPENMLAAVFEIAPGDPWNQERVAEAAQRLARFYRDLGFLLVRVGEPRAEPLPSGEVALTLDIEPGLPVRIVFGGNDHAAVEDLTAVAALDETSEFTPLELGNACDRLAAHYRGLGYPDASVSWSTAEALELGPPPSTPHDDPGLWSAGADRADSFGPLGEWAPPQDDRPSRLVWQLRFEVREGPRLEVERIAWEGNGFFSDEQLDEMVVELVAAELERPSVLETSAGESGGTEFAGDPGLGGTDRTPLRLAPWGPERIYLDAAFRAAAGRVEERYRTEGFLGVRVEMAEPEADPSEGTIRPAFRVTEGPRSMLGTLDLVGNLQLGDEPLFEAFLVQSGDPVNELLVEETRRALLELYAAHGYLYAQVERRAVFSDDRSRLDLTFAVTEGPEVHVRSIEVTGNTETATSLILDTLSFEVGDVFSPDAADGSEQRLLRMGIFQGVTISPVEPDRVEGDKIITVQVREHPPQSLELRAGFSTAEGARGSFAYAYRNLFGYAVGLSLRAQLNYQLFFLGNDSYEQEFSQLPLQDQLERLIVGGLNIPYLPGLGSLIATQLDLANERNNEPFYGIDRSSAFLGLSTGWRKLLSFSLRAGIEYNDVTRFGGDAPVCTGDEEPGALCLDPEDARRLRTPQGESTFAVVRATAAVDWRDDPFNPTQGLYFAALAEWVRSFDLVFDAGTGTSSFSNLIRASFQLSAYAPLGAGLVFAVAGRYGQIFQLQSDSRTFPDRYFYLGGYDTLRGFPQESVSVADAPYGIPSPGGNLFLVFRGELRIPIGDAFGTALFTDIGNVWRDPEKVDLTELRYAAGAGLRIQTPIGPLAFDFGINLDPRDDWSEDFGALHFSIGMF